MTAGNSDIYFLPDHYSSPQRLPGLSPTRPPKVQPLKLTTNSRPIPSPQKWHSKLPGEGGLILSSSVIYEGYNQLTEALIPLQLASKLTGNDCIMKQSASKTQKPQTPGPAKLYSNIHTYKHTPWETCSVPPSSHMLYRTWDTCVVWPVLLSSSVSTHPSLIP